jgi:hypothetical protein
MNIFILKKLHNRLLVSLVFALTCVRLAVAGTFPSAERAAHQIPRSFPGRRGLLFRFSGLSARGELGRGYGLEMTGTFPFVRVISSSIDVIHVPIELAALPSFGVSDRTDSGQSESTPVIYRANPDSLGADPEPIQDVRPACIGCSCGGGGCSSCGDCGSCASCSSCANCTC